MVAPGNGRADTRSACTTSDAVARRPSCASAETRQARSPVACGAAMLVPSLISSPVAQGGTTENATPGVTTSGFTNSPPRELNQARTSRGAGTPGWGARANTPGNVAPTDSARSAEPGKPIAGNDGPGLS